MMKKTAIVLLLIASIQASAQVTPERIIIYGVPQYLFTNGLRIDADIRQGNTNNWFTISPYYYSDVSSIDPFNLNENNDYVAHSYNKMEGFGLGIAQRYILSKTIKNEGFYLKYGTTYKHFNIEGTNYTYREYTGDDGLTYQGMREGEYTIAINSIMGNICIGYQYELITGLYVDAFIGFGLRYSHHQSGQNVTTKYNRSSIDYGYTGTLPVGGFRVGVAL